VERARAEAALEVALHVVLDRPDDRTVQVAADSLPSGASLAEVDHGDLALSRSAGIEAVEAQYVALMDGDDLWGEEWLLQAYRHAAGTQGDAIWHPEINVMFGGDRPQLFVHKDTTEPGFDDFELIDHNHWTSLSFAARTTYLEHPFHPLHLTGGRGFEDWSWNCRTLAAGIEHRVVPDTVHFVRRRPGSLSKVSELLGILPEPTKLFRRHLGRVGTS
jgi:hypothetical protein